MDRVCKRRLFASVTATGCRLDRVPMASEYHWRDKRHPNNSPRASTQEQQVAPSHGAVTGDDDGPDVTTTALSACETVGRDRAPTLQEVDAAIASEKVAEEEARRASILRRQQRKAEQQREKEEEERIENERAEHKRRIAAEQAALDADSDEDEEDEEDEAEANERKSQDAMLRDLQQTADSQAAAAQELQAQMDGLLEQTSAAAYAAAGATMSGLNDLGSPEAVLAALRAKKAKKAAAQAKKEADGTAAPEKEKPKKEMSFMEQLKAKTAARRG